MELTQAELKEILNYNPETGIFTWLIKPRPQSNIGDIAGSSHNKGYIVIKINKKLYLAHRLAWLYMTGNWPVNQIDHINRIRNDNRFENLRDTDKNNWNGSERKDNTSGYKGVYWHKKANKWCARIRVNGKRIHLGYFTDIEEAAKAYEEAKEKYHLIGE